MMNDQAVIVGRVETEPSTRFVADVYTEWRAAIKAHPPIQTHHEASAVIREEFEEFWELVKQRNPDRAAMRGELIQIAAMCLRTVCDLHL